MRVQAFMADVLQKVTEQGMVGDQASRRDRAGVTDAATAAWLAGMRIGMTACPGAGGEPSSRISPAWRRLAHGP
jgi:hypothetical protein